MSPPNHHFDRFAIVHVAIAVRHTIEIHHAIEHLAGLDASFENIWQECSVYARTGAGSPPTLIFLKNNGLRAGMDS